MRATIVTIIVPTITDRFDRVNQNFGEIYSNRNRSSLKYVFVIVHIVVQVSSSGIVYGGGVPYVFIPCMNYDGIGFWHFRNAFSEMKYNNIKTHK